jgi:hypothetical protein
MALSGVVQTCSKPLSCDPIRSPGSGLHPQKDFGVSEPRELTPRLCSGCIVYPSRDTHQVTPQQELFPGGSDRRWVKTTTRAARD